MIIEEIFGAYKKNAIYTPKSSLVNGVKTNSTPVNLIIYLQPSDGVLEYENTSGGQTFFGVVEDTNEIKRDGIFTVDSINYSIIELEKFPKTDILEGHYQIILEKYE
jgi:hypothetical protein